MEKVFAYSQNATVPETTFFGHCGVAYLYFVSPLVPYHSATQNCVRCLKPYNIPL